jgi:hypothetical protein
MVDVLRGRYSGLSVSCMKFSYPRLSAVLGDSAVPLVLRVAKTVKMKKRKNGT